MIDTAAGAAAVLSAPGMDLVTVIVPVYNGAATLAQALDSVLAQSHRHLQVLVIDDGSTDRTAEIAAAYGDPRLALHRFPNAGVTVSRNRGVRLAEGRYVAFLDADDWWRADKLEKQLAALAADPAAGVAYSFTTFVDERGEVLHGGYQVPVSGDVLPRLFVRFFLQCGSNALVRREVFARAGLFDETLEVCEDYDFYLRAAACCPFALVPEHQVSYRKHAGSSSSDAQRVRRSADRVIAAAVARHPAELGPLRWQARAVFDAYLVGVALENPADWRHAALAGRCLYHHLRAGRAGWRLLWEKRNAAGFWLRRLAGWLLPDRLRHGLRRPRRPRRPRRSITPPPAAPL